MLGSAKGDLPSPPKAGPSSENSAVCCEIGRSWPSQKTQPLGAKLKGKMRISATKGSGHGAPSGLAREDAEQRDDEVEAEERLEILVRLVAAGRPDRPPSERLIRSILDVHLGNGRLGEHVAAGPLLVSNVLGRQGRMVVHRHLLRAQRYRLAARCLIQLRVGA